MFEEHYNYETASLEELWKCLCPEVPTSAVRIKPLFVMAVSGIAHKFAIRHDAAACSRAIETACEESLKSPTPWLGFIDLKRENMSKDDNSANGLHLNALWILGETKKVCRFDPYYACVLKDTIRLQKKIDVVFESLVPKGWTYESCASDEALSLLPFGPQLLDATPSEERKAVVKLGCEQEFCAPWCMLALKFVFENKGSAASLTPANAGLYFTKSLKLPRPTTLEEAYAAAGKYFVAIANEARCAVKGGKDSKKRTRDAKFADDAVFASTTHKMVHK